MFNTDTLAPLKGYYPFPMFNTLYRLSRQVSCETDSADVYALAARNRGKAAVLVTYYTDNDDAPPVEAKVHLTGLSEGRVWKISYRLLDAFHDSELIREERFSAGAMDTYLTLPLFGTYLLELTRA